MIVGGLFVYAAFKVASEQAGSIGDALKWARGRPLGGMLYVWIAFDLVSFGACNVIQARCRIVHKPDIGNELARVTR